MARNRNVQIIFWVSEAEKRMIEEKMTQAGMTNLSAYLRRIAIDGMIVRLELPELKEIPWSGATSRRLMISHGSGVSRTN